MKNQLNDILDNDESVLWQGKPTLIPFIANGIPFLLFGLIWGLIDLGFIGSAFSSPSGGPVFFLIPFFFLHSMPFWLGILNFVRLFLVFNNTVYAITNKRVLLRSGFFGIDFKSIDYDKIMDIHVNVNPLENLFKVGTIRINSGSTNSKGVNIFDSMLAISDPYEVFKKIKTTSVNIKTDWNYPNKIRPDENPGYKSKYNPQ